MYRGSTRSVRDLSKEAFEQGWADDGGVCW